jgi:hypothetical protein
MESSVQLLPSQPLTDFSIVDFGSQVLSWHAAATHVSMAPMSHATAWPAAAMANRKAVATASFFTAVLHAGPCVFTLNCGSWKESMTADQNQGKTLNGGA